MSMPTPIVSRLVPSTLGFLLLLGAHACADIKLPSILGDHMVLQQQTDAALWGWADPGESVEASFLGTSASAVAGPDGRWSLNLSTPKAGANGDLKLRGKNTITLKDVLVGEVWLASGQSNMEWPLAKAANALQEIATAKLPQIRLFTVRRSAHEEPQQDCEGHWEVCSPESVVNFSAVAYFFGRALHNDLGFPVGLVHSSWGGTPAEFWTPKEVLDAIPEFRHLSENWEKTKANYPKAKAEFEEKLNLWRAASAKAKTDGTPAPQPPRPPNGGDATGSPSSLYNGMIAPLTSFSIQGVIWYQGEANAGRAREYHTLFPTLIASWRREWEAELPFLFVQLANFNARRLPPSIDPEESHWAELREAQLRTLEVPRTGMAVTIDIGEGDNIHPKNKQEVGRRLALVAKASVYFVDTAYCGPVLNTFQLEAPKVRLSFRNSDALKASDGGNIKGFAVAGEDRVFHWAEAEVQDSHVIVSSPRVPHPVAVRYGWADNPSCNLTNASALPASPFRTDDWPQPTPAK